MKSLQERQADRAKRKEEAQKAAEENGTAQPKDDGDGKDYSSMTVADLKAELDSRQVAYESGAKKADLVALLEENDAE